MKIEEKFIKYENLLKSWSTKMNLVAPSTLNDIQNRHIKDSAQLEKFIAKDISIIDLGSGAGFPGVVLAILGYNVTCIESITKKANFLSTLKKELDLPNLTIINNRVESFLSKTPVKADKTIFTARAFAPLIKILGYTHITNCQLFLLKGRDVLSEIKTAKTKYKFEYKLYPSTTGDGHILHIFNAK